MMFYGKKKRVLCSIYRTQPVWTYSFYSFLQQGTENRATGSTDMNDVSSRSHAIFSVTLKQEKWVPSSPQSSRAASPLPNKQQHSKQQRLSTASRSNGNPGEDGDWVITNSKFHFVDLAGSERVSTMQQAFKTHLDLNDSFFLSP